MKDPQMWQRCRSYGLPDGPDGQDFIAWVAEEESIAKSRASELVLEYRRFTYLAACGAVDHPVAPGLIGRVHALHAASGDFERYRQEALAGATWPDPAAPVRRTLAAMTVTYEAEFGKVANPRIWTRKSALLLWVVAALLAAAGAVAALIDGSLAPLALGGIPAVLMVLYILTAGKMAGADGLSEAGRYGGGMGGGGPN